MTPMTTTTTSELGWALSDSFAMIGRSVRHGIRNTDALIMAAVSTTSSAMR